MRVMTGNAMAPPPSLVAPAINEPKAMVRDMNQLVSKRCQSSKLLMMAAQMSHTMRARRRLNLIVKVVGCGCSMAQMTLNLPE